MAAVIYKQGLAGRGSPPEPKVLGQTLLSDLL